MKSKIAVIGCGWLGFPLAETLIKEGCLVHGTTTSETKLASLQSSGITPFLVEISSEGITGELNSCLSKCDTAIINIPPGLRKDPKHNYVQKMTPLFDTIKASSIQHILFIGSTSIYDDQANFPLITENSMPSKSQKALQLLEVESMFRNNKSFQTTILRFSGLFAEDRHPARFLSGRTGVKNPKAPVNLIHRDDCISIILSILQNNVWGTVFNASTSAHPTKQSYYTSVCKTLKIAVPEFDTNSSSKGKIIDSRSLIQALNYEFKVTISSS